MNETWIHNEILALREDIARLREDVIRTREDIAALKVRAGIMGFLAGAVASCMEILTWHSLK